ncbi:hypothetical protein AAMO2058_001329900 [Amorphochlora amoebiformis]
MVIDKSLWSCLRHFLPNTTRKRTQNDFHTIYWESMLLRARLGSFRARVKIHEMISARIIKQVIKKPKAQEMPTEEDTLKAIEQGRYLDALNLALSAVRRTNETRVTEESHPESTSSGRFTCRFDNQLCRSLYNLVLLEYNISSSVGHLLINKKGRGRLRALKIPKQKGTLSRAQTRRIVCKELSKQHSTGKLKITYQQMWEALCQGRKLVRGEMMEQEKERRIARIKRREESKHKKSIKRAERQHKLFQRKAEGLARRREIKARRRERTLKEISRKIQIYERRTMQLRNKRARLERGKSKSSSRVNPNRKNATLNLELQPESKLDPTPEPKPEPTSESKPETRSKAKLDISEPKPEPRPEPNETRLEPRPEPKETRPEARPEPKVVPEEVISFGRAILDTEGRGKGNGEDRGSAIQIWGKEDEEARVRDPTCEGGRDQLEMGVEIPIFGLGTPTEDGGNSSEYERIDSPKHLEHVELGIQEATSGGQVGSEVSQELEEGVVLDSEHMNEDLNYD